MPLVFTTKNDGVRTGANRREKFSKSAAERRRERAGNNGLPRLQSLAEAERDARIHTRDTPQRTGYCTSLTLPSLKMIFRSLYWYIFFKPPRKETRIGSPKIATTSLSDRPSAMAA